MRRRAKATGCAVVGVYEDGELGDSGPPDRCPVGRADRASCSGSGDFAAKLGDMLLLPAPAGAAAARVLLGRPRAPARASAASNTARRCRPPLRRSARPAPSDAVVYLALEEVAGSRRAIPRARRRGSVLRAALQDSRPEDRRQAQSPRACRASVWRWPMRAPRKRRRKGCASARRSAAGSHCREILPICRPMCARRPTWEPARRRWPRSLPASKPRCWMRAASRRSRWARSSR